MRENIQDKSLYAAVDLGSNSFHMIVVKRDGDDFITVDKARSVVRLAAGIDKEGLDSDTEQRAFQALSQFRLGLLKVPSSNIRVVGTSAVRRLDDRGGFVRKASEVLGLPIDIISGAEEARLINIGVVSASKDKQVVRLIMDIGGGSTEIIVGKNTEVLRAESLSMGCVVFSRRFFPDGEITRKTFRKAEEAAERKLTLVIDKFSDLRWTDAIGTSGTIKAVRRVMKSHDWGEKEITADALDRIVDAAVDIGHSDRLHSLRGLSLDRAPVFHGGIAILQAIMRRFGVKGIRVSKSAMREGIVHDLAFRNP